MDGAILIKWVHNWRRVLTQEICATSEARIEDTAREVQSFLCNAIISQMLASRGILDARCWMLDTRGGKQMREELSGMDLSEIPFEILSDIYESHLARKLVLNNSTGELEYSPEGGLRKGKGIYYTPPYVVRYIVDRTLGRHLWGTENGRPAKNMTARTPGEIRDLRILDPACGSGSFLSYAFDVLAEFYAFHNPCAEAEWLSLILENHLYGIDMDSDAVDMTCKILRLKALERRSRENENPPSPLFQGGVRSLNMNIRKGNFLISDPSAPENLEHFDWKTEAPEVMGAGGFSMILGNPPYGAKLTPTERKLIKKSYETHKSSDSSSLFVEKAVNMLKDDGLMGFIVPKSLSYVVAWQPIRKFLLKNCRIIEIADARKAFKGVLLEQMVMIARKQTASPDRTVVSILRPESAVASHSIDSSAMTAERFSIWLSSDRIRGIVDRIWEKSVPLGQIAEIWNGLNIQRLPIFSDVRDAEHDRPCLRGKNIQRYRIRQDMQYIQVTDAVKRQRLSLEMFRRPKIVAQDIIAHIKNPQPRIKLMAAIDRSADWLNVNTVTNITSSEYSLEYLCGILNSRLISWYAYDFIYNRSIRTMHFRNGYADQIPICRMERDKAMYEQLTAYVNEIIALYNGETPQESEIAALEKKIDEMVYKLYGITDRDVSFLSKNAGFC